MFESSLVQYENPQVIAHKSTKIAIEANKEKAEKMVLMSVEELTNETATSDLDMLDVLMPPRIVEDGVEFWYQKVSRAPASISDLLHLQERFDNELLRLGAREIGLCEVRRSVYDQLFDELTRQEIVVCPERGRLLRMIRRETELSMTSLINCYESGVAYGIKKKLTAYNERNKLSAEVTKLLSKISEVNDEIQDLEPRVAEIKKTIESKEAEKDEEFKAIEDQIEKENEKLMGELMECINVSIDEDDVE